jgi:hypothetical protein
MEENLKENQNAVPYGLRYPHRNFKSENAQEPQRNCRFMNAASQKYSAMVNVSVDTLCFRDIYR